MVDTKTCLSKDLQGLKQNPNGIQAIKQFNVFSSHHKDFFIA